MFAVQHICVKLWQATEHTNELHSESTNVHGIHIVSQYACFDVCVIVVVYLFIFFFFVICECCFCCCCLCVSLCLWFSFTLSFDRLVGSFSTLCIWCVFFFLGLSGLYVAVCRRICCRVAPSLWLSVHSSDSSMYKGSNDCIHAIQTQHTAQLSSAYLCMLYVFVLASVCAWSKALNIVGFVDCCMWISERKEEENKNRFILMCETHTLRLVNTVRRIHTVSF